MAIFNFLKSQLIDIVEWNQTDAQAETISWRFPRGDNEIKNGAKLIVREGQMAVFVNMGKLADTFGPGMYTLETKNLPILSNLMGWKYGFESPFKCEVYFISTKRFTDQKWGTGNPVMMRDQDFGMVRIRAYGSYAMQVVDGPAFLRQLLSTDPSFQVVDISGQLRNLIVTRFSDAVASSNIPVLDLASNLDELSTYCQQRIGADFQSMGLGVPMFFVENISLPDNVEKALDKRTSMGIVGNMDQYMRFQAAEAMEAAAANPSGGAAGIGVGLGAGMAMANQFVGAFQGAPQGAAGAPAPPPMPGAAPPPMPAVLWYAGVRGQQLGPFDDGVLAEQVRNRVIGKDDLVWKAGMAQWTKAGELPELAAHFASVPPPMPGA
jgi:membrane protease subunit (stomatin/prohibitin family)